VRIVAIVAALLAVAGAQASLPAYRPVAGLKAPSGQLLGVVWTDRTAKLTRLDPATLEPVGTRLKLKDVGAWGFSPRRDVLALGASRSPLVRFVDLRSLEPFDSISLGRGGAVERIDWLSATSMVVLYSDPAGARIAWVDPTRGRVVKRARLVADPYQAVSGGGRLVALLPPRKGIGAARLAVLGAGGRIRSVRLPQIRIGASRPGADMILRRISPGLALDPAGAHAYVVGTDGVVADVDLRSLAVANHLLARPRSLARLAAWIEPAAEAKAIDGPSLNARWLGDGFIAVAGTSYRATARRGAETQSATPLGLRVVDIRSWTQRTIDASATGFAIADHALLAYGVRSEFGAGVRTVSGMGVAAYGPDGSMRFRLLPTMPISYLQVNGSRAYGWVLDAANAWHLVVVDVAAGAVERELTLAHPTRLLLAAG
jgi:hypothetical protein